MKRIFPALLFLACSAANAQFVTGQILTAAQLNAAFANVLATSGGTLTGPLTVQGSTTVANLTVNGTFTVPGGFSPGSLSPQAANSLLGNASGTTQVPGVIAVPSCSASGNALKWTSANGFTCGTGNALTANPLSQFAATTSAQLAGIISDETGSGSLLFGTSPTISTPAISGGTISGTPISGSTGAFTTLSASSTVSGAGFTTLLSPYLTSATAASTYAPIASPTFTGTVTIPGGASIGGYAPLASPTFTGTPAAPTATAGTSTTQLATTAFVTAQPTINQPNIVATTTGTAATAGSVGYAVSFATAAVSASSGVPLNVTSTTTPLSAGIWNVQCTAQYVAAGTTVTQLAEIGVSTTSATLGAYSSLTESSGVTTAGFGQVFSSPMVRLPLTTATTVFCVAQSNFTTSTMQIGGTITATLVH